jgi:beta-galactosidase GanA
MSFIDGQDFSEELAPTYPLPDGSVVETEILNRDKTFHFGVWAWALDVDSWNWTIRIDAADHANIVAGSWFRLFVTYPDDGGRICWLAGPVERNRR